MPLAALKQVLKEGQPKKRRCTHCSKTKPIEEFSYKYKLFERRHSHCKVCQRKYARGHYNNNKSVYLRKARKNQAKVLAINRRKMISYLNEKKCQDCGCSDIRVLEFFHKIKAQENASVGNLLSKGWSWKRVEIEMNKCIVVCANCRIIRETNKKNFYRKNNNGAARRT